MQRHPLAFLIAVTVAVLTLTGWVVATRQAPPQVDKAAKQRSEEAYGRLPLRFEHNEGQADARVRYVSRGSGYTLFLTSTGAVFTLQQPEADAAVLRMTLVGANPRPRVAGGGELPGKSHYLMGNDPAQWRTNVPGYARVQYTEVYPGVDLVYYGNQRRLEYDFVVAPGADPDDIAVAFEGADDVTLDANGDLVLATAGGAIRHRRPFIYQERDGVRQEVQGGYRLAGAREVRFTVARYDTGRPLVIDPVLEYGTYLGGGGSEQGYEIALDADGSAYVTGHTPSSNFPATPGTLDTTLDGGSDAFVTKLNPAGSALEYSTYLGGSHNDGAYDIAVDAGANAYVTGFTLSANFPTTGGAFATAFNGNADAFVVKLNPNGSMGYGTYLGGSSNEHGRDIVVDAAGSSYVTGFTQSANFPTTTGAFDETWNGGDDAFVTKLSVTGSALAYSTYLGGGGFDSAQGIAVDATGSVYVTGSTASADFPTTPAAFDMTLGGTRDAFVAKVNVTGSALEYSTYLGGGGFDSALSIAVDAGGGAHVAGSTSSTDFPTTPAAFATALGGTRDAFVTTLNAAGSALDYATYLGGSGSDGAEGVAVDASGHVYVTGSSASSDFPVTADALAITFGGGSSDAFMTKLNPASGLEFSTYLGGASYDLGSGIAVDARGNVYVMGETSSANFPTTPAAFDTTANGLVDAFVVKIDFPAVPATLTLDPSAADNPVGTQHCVTATVQDAFGDPAPDVPVRFGVSGAATTSGSDTTDAGGEAHFCYQGPALPGADAIAAHADTDGDDVHDAGEPSGAASKTWAPPASTPGCFVAGAGTMRAANGDAAAFLGVARSRSTGVAGRQAYQDLGPAQPMRVVATSVLALVQEGPKRVSVYGEAAVNGAGSFGYRITFDDGGEPGRNRDRYSILVSNGYASGEPFLQLGSIVVRCGLPDHVRDHREDD